MASHWDRRFLDLAALIASWSKDPSTQVGAVLVDPAHRIISLGYNGPPHGVDDSRERLQDRETKLRCTLHAEENAILFAQGRSLAGACCYTWPMPACAHCAAQLIQVGIGRVVSPYPDQERWGRWGSDFRLAAQMFNEVGVEIVHLSEDAQ